MISAILHRSTYTQLFKVFLELILRKSSRLELFLISSISSSIPTTSLFPNSLFPLPVSSSPEESITYLHQIQQHVNDFGSVHWDVMWWFHWRACACLRCLSRIVVVPLPLSKLSSWLPSCHLLASDLDCDVEGAKRSVEAFTFKNRKNITNSTMLYRCFDMLGCHTE